MKRLTCILILVLSAALPIFGLRQDPRNLQKEFRLSSENIFVTGHSNGGIEVSLYEVVGAGHSINSMGLDYAAVVWNFFKRYLK